MSSETIVQVTTDRFCAGLVVREGRIVKAAPAFQKFVGQDFEWFKRAAKTAKWKVEILGNDDYWNRLDDDWNKILK